MISSVFVYVGKLALFYLIIKTTVIFSLTTELSLQKSGIQVKNHLQRERNPMLFPHEKKWSTQVTKSIRLKIYIQIQGIINNSLAWHKDEFWPEIFFMINIHYWIKCTNKEWDYVEKINTSFSSFD